MKLSLLLFCVVTAFGYGKQLMTPPALSSNHTSSSAGSLRGSEQQPCPDDDTTMMEVMIVEDDGVDYDIEDHYFYGAGNSTATRNLAASGKNPTCRRKKACESFLGIGSWNCRWKTYCCYTSHKQWSRCYGFARFTRYYYKQNYGSTVRSITDWDTCWSWSFKGKNSYKNVKHCRGD